MSCAQQEKLSTSQEKSLSSALCPDNDQDIDGESTKLFCSVCARNILQPLIERRKRAMEEHATAKKHCASHLAQIPRSRVPELQAESQRLREQLSSLRNDCSSMAVKVARLVLENDTLRESASMDQSLERQRNDLMRLDNSLLEEGMAQAIDNQYRYVRFLRFQWARKVMAMYKIDTDDVTSTTPLHQKHSKQADSDSSRNSSSRDIQDFVLKKPLQCRRARGISKISGLPLPNAGPELYGVLPPQELQSALRLVATVTSTVARCLGIVLPHRILLTLKNSSAGDIIDEVTEEDIQRRRRNFRLEGIIGDRGSKDEMSVCGFDNVDNKIRQKSNLNSASVGCMNNDSCDSGRYDAINNGSNSTYNQTKGSYTASSLRSLVDGSYWTNKMKKKVGEIVEKNIYNRGNNDNASSNTDVLFRSESRNPLHVSTDAKIVRQRLDHATCAILTDIDTSNCTSSMKVSPSRFALSSKQINEDGFAIALQLLQNDVIVLCMRAGVPISKLWPAEAMLLNLFSLQEELDLKTDPFLSTKDTEA